MFFKNSIRSMPLLGTIGTLLFFSSCGSDDTEPNPEPSFSSDFTVNRVFDLGNAQNPSDIYISATIANLLVVKQFRAIVVKSDGIIDLSEEVLMELPASTYTHFDVINKSVAGRLKSEQTDIGGNPLLLETDYQIVLFNPDDFAMSIPSTSFQLTDVAPLSGEYVGTWNDNLFSGIMVSARISSNTEGKYQGDFFISTNLTPSWGGVTDGGISFNFTDSEIEGFIYNQDLPNYMGGCPGIYTGSGDIEDEINLIIEFIGDDCDGHHTDGEIVLTRIK